MGAADKTQYAHAGGRRGFDTGTAVLDDQARAWIDAHPGGRVQKEIGRRFAAFDHRRAENMRGEIVEQAGAAEGEGETVGIGARRDAARRRQVVEYGGDAGHRLEFACEGRLQARAQDLREIVGQLAAKARFDGSEHRGAADADELLGDLVGGDGDADLTETFGVDAAGDDLAVDQHAVAIEDEKLR